MVRIFKALSDGRAFVHIGLEEAERDARETCVEVDPETHEPIASAPTSENTPTQEVSSYAVVYPFAPDQAGTPAEVEPATGPVDAAGGVMPDTVAGVPFTPPADDPQFTPASS